MKTLIALFILWLPFSLMALVAIPVSLIAIWFEDWPYAKDILRAMDKLGAAVMGWSGRYSVSAECGRSECRLCRVLCWLLDLVQPGHCKGAAEREGR